jgi:ankyrin repeat protein
MKQPARRFGDVPSDDMREVATTPPVPVGGPSVTPLQAASGVGYALGFAANEHRIHPAGWMAAVKYLVDELHADVNARDADGNTALHHAASRGDNEMIHKLMSKGADLKAVNGGDRTWPTWRTVPSSGRSRIRKRSLLESLGVKHNNKCVSC